MSTPILATKLYIPPHRANVVLRSRLMDRLNEGLHHKLTLISAPAGFGKTTLVSEWIACCGRPAAWLSLDEGDGDPARFWSHFVAALQSLALSATDGLAANLGAGALRALQSPQPPSGEIQLGPLLNEIASIPDAFVLVLDDYHLIDSPHVSHALAFLIERQPPQMHLVIATREDPDLPLARLRARDQLTELRVKDLRFTDSEAAEFLTHAMGLGLSPDDVQALETRTEGWIAGLQLAALSMQGLPDPARAIPSFTGSHHYVLDYLLEEVLHKQSADLQTFLLRTSILERMCGPLCEAVLLHPQIAGQATLEHLDHANLFLVPLDPERRWYRYHHLFRDLLRQRLQVQDSPETVARLHIHASEWLEANGELAEAFQHALAGAEVDRAARLAESAWQSMNKSFQMGTWLRWVNQLPSDSIRVRPVLCTQMGQAYMDTGNVHASESSLRDAEQALRLPPDEIIVVEKDQVPALPAQIAFARAYNAQSQGRSSAAVEYAQRALDLTPVEDVFLQAQVSTLLLATHWANGDLDGARQLIGDFVDASERAGHLFFAIAGAFGKADLLNAQGRLREVRRTYEAALELAAAHHAEQHTAHHHLGLGLVYHEMGEDERAARHLQKSFELGRQTTIVDWGYRKTLAQAQLKDAEGDLESALDLLEEAQRLYIRTPSPNLRPVDAMKARLHLKQGTLSKAQAWARTTGLSLRDDPDYLHEFERLTLARVALADYRDAPDEDRWLATLGLLDRHLELAEKQNRLRSQVDILVVRSLAFHARGEMADALAPLERALTLAEPEGFLRIFASEGKPMVQMLSQLKKRSLTPYVRRIQAFRGPLPSGPPTPVVRQPLVDPLSQRELGVLRLLAEGLSNQEIAQKLFVTLSTVKGHNLRIFAKLQVRNRTEAVARARELGLL